jgi:cytidylate kinase
MIICISGLSGSGKNSVGTAVARLLRLRVVDPTFKTLAAKQRMTLLEFQKKAEKDHDIDKKFDDALRAETRRGDCVVTTWLGPWMIEKADLRIWLYAPQAVRAKRVAGRDGMDAEAALKHISERDDDNHHRYRDIYGIDIYDHSGFDLIINTTGIMPDESAEIIACAARLREGRKKAPAAKTPAKPKAKKRK